MVDTILKERKEQYGDFKANVETMKALKSSFQSKETKENHDILAFFLCLKMARILYIWNKNYDNSALGALEKEDSYLDLLGYIVLIKNYFNTHKMRFEIILLDDQKTQDLKRFVNFKLSLLI